MRRLFTPAQFATLEEAQQRDSEVSIATASIGDPEVADAGRLVRYTFSTPAVGRDMHTVASNAWQLQNFLRNPVFLWAHDDSLPPIGRVVEIGDVNGVLRGTVEYAEQELNPFAETIYQLVRAKYINAVSTSWQPMEWQFSREKTRPGGVDFTKVDLLEISQVPIPALPAALAEARSRGIDTGPLREWAERILDTGGLIALPRAELEDLRRAAQMPAAAKPAATNGSSDALKAKHARALTRAPKMPIFKRGLYDVAQMAYLLEQLGYCHSCHEYETALEGDESPVPSMIAEAIEAFAEAFKLAAEEEADELLEAHEDDDGEGGEGEVMVREEETRALPAEERAWIAEGKTSRARAWRAGLAVARAGKALSASNQDKLEQADGHHERAMKHSRALEEHHSAVAGHMKEDRDAHGAATSTLAEFGEHVRAAQEEPDEPAHLKRAMKTHKAVTEHLETMGEAHRNMADRHEDVGDSHRALARCVKSAQRCVRSVVDGAQQSEPDENEGDDQGDKNDKEKDAVERRRRRARAIALAEG